MVVRLCCRRGNRSFFDDFPVEASFLPDLDAEPYMAFALRNSVSGYDGPLFDVRRSSDNAVSGIGFLSNGELDTGSLLSFVGGANGYISTWYDQTPNANHIVNATTSTQPQLVSSGSIIMDLLGNNTVHFLVSSLANVALSHSISNQDMCFFFAGQEPEDEGSTNNHLFHMTSASFIRAEWTDSYQVFRIRMGDGIGSTTNQVNSSAGSYSGYYTYPGIFNINLSGQDMTWSRNRHWLHTFTHSLNPASSSDMNFGVSAAAAVDYYLSEFYMYPALSETDRISVYKTINRTNELYGPNEINEQALMWQAEKWQVDLYDWLETISLSDVTLERESLFWDGTFSDHDDLGRMYLATAAEGSVLQPDVLMRSDPVWSILDDSKGGGIEGDGVAVKSFHPESNSGSHANNCAHWYYMSYPLSGGGNGSVYYNKRAVALRALVAAAVNLIEFDKWAADMAGNNFWAENPFTGGALLGSVEAYRLCKSELTPAVRAAFVAGLKWYAWKLLQEVPYEVNANMDLKAVAALSHVYHEVDAEGKDWCLRSSKKTLFGSETGTPETTDPIAGVYHKSGHIGEANTPETTYNGQSIKYISRAYAAIRDISAWDFIGEVAEKMTNFKILQTFRDPDGRLDGPSGYAGRTGGAIWYDQGGNLRTRDFTLTADFVNAHSFINNNVILPDPSGTVTAIQTSINTFNVNGYATLYDITGMNGAHTSGVDGDTVYFVDNPDLSSIDFPNHRWYIYLDYSGGQWVRFTDFDDTAKTLTLISSGVVVPVPAGSPVDYKITVGPKNYSADGAHWPTTTHWLPSDGWYDSIRALIEADDESLLMPFDFSGDPFNISLNDEFWSYRATDPSGQDYGWFLEALPYPGGYKGWFGGCLQTFWTNNYGIALISKHDGAGDVPPGENTRVWDEVDQWATTHIWGTMVSGNRFSTAATDSMDFYSVFDLSGLPPSVTISGILATDNGRNNSDQGVEAALTFSGQLQWQYTYRDTGQGLSCQVDYTSSQEDVATYLWYAIPVYLREADQSISDATVGFWSGSTWLPISTTVGNAQWFRIGRDYDDGEGPRYLWINLGEERQFKASEFVWEQSYQQTARCRNIHVNMRPEDPGVAALLPLSGGLTWEITTIDPGFVAVAPIAQMVYPRANDPLPSGRPWVAQASVEFIGVSGSVDLEYTIDNSGWVTIGAMENTTGNTWEFVGGEIPSGVAAIRLNASDTSGTTNTGTEIVISTSVYTEYFFDEFSVPDSTLVDASYSGWTTNVVGSPYELPVATDNPYVSGGMIRGEGTPNYNQVRMFIGSNRYNTITEADIIVYGVGTSTTQNQPGMGARGRSSNFGQSYFNSSFLKMRPGASNQLHVYTYDGGGGWGPDEYLDIPSYNQANPYRLCLDMRENIMLIQLRDPSDDSIILQKGYFGLEINTGYHMHSLVCGFEANGATLDNFRIFRE